LGELCCKGSHGITSEGKPRANDSGRMLAPIVTDVHGTSDTLSDGIRVGL